MKLVSKKKIYFFIFLFINIVPIIYGMERLKSFSDIKSLQQLQKLESLRGNIEVILINDDGSLRSVCQVENPQQRFLKIKDRQELPLIQDQLENLPNKTQKELTRHFQGNIRQRRWASWNRKSQRGKHQDDDRYLIISPEKFVTERFLLQIAKAVLNNKIVIKILVDAVPEELIKFIPKYSLGNKREKELTKKLIMQKKEKEKALKELKEQKESLKESPEYFKQLALLQRH